MKLNHFVCPNCGHDFYAEGGYATCDGCQVPFYVSQSQTCRPNGLTLTLRPGVLITGGTFVPTSNDSPPSITFTAKGNTP